MFGYIAALGIVSMLFFIHFFVKGRPARPPRFGRHVSPASGSPRLSMVGVLLLIVVLLVAGWFLWPWLSVYFQASSTTMATNQSAQGPLSPTSPLTGSPTVSADLINQVLSKAHSPAQGMGQDLYQMGKQYGIDPAYALAFFGHESHFGTQGVARVTHSWGNIRCVSGWPRCVDGFKYYTTWKQSAEDWYQLIRAYIEHGTQTLAAIVHTYAPNGDGANDEAAYSQAVLTQVARWRQGQV